MKACSRCSVERPLSDYYTDRTGRDGYRAECKPCIRSRMQGYYREHRDESLVRSRRWFVENRGIAHDHAKKYYEGHREQVIARTSRNHTTRWATQREKEQARHRQWRQQNPETASQRKKRRRALKYGAEIRDLTRRQWDEIKALYGYRCAYCGERPLRLTQDHVIPLARGGNHTASNIVPACKSCNSKKRTGPPPTYQPLLMVPISATLPRR